MTPEVIALVVALLAQMVRSEVHYRKNGKVSLNGQLRGVETKLEKLCNGTMKGLTRDVDKLERLHINKDKSDAIIHERMVGILEGIKESVDRLRT